MSSEDFYVIKTCINKEKEFLNGISQEIWKNPELGYEENQAHDVLTSALEKQGFEVDKQFLLPTAFKATFTTNTVSAPGPTIAILLEYDALPEIGHACGHNLIAEAGLAAGIAIKAIMEKDSAAIGKLVLLGTPAEEGGGGKVRLLKLGAFQGIDAAMMVHPTTYTSTYAPILACVRYKINFKGKEAHASVFPWKGVNALDAAVACYNNISMLRQQLKSSCRINVIITKGGTAANIIPAESSMTILLRAATTGQLRVLQTQLQKCVDGAAVTTGCEVEIELDENAYENHLSNRVLGEMYNTYAKMLGFDSDPPNQGALPAGSTDMGNVSHRMPSLHPFYDIGSREGNHAPGFTAAAGAPEAQEPTLKAAMAMAMTAIQIIRRPEVLEKAKVQFEQDLKMDAMGESE